MPDLPQMRYRRFGRTELQMPVYSCGGMRYQHKWEDIDPKDVPKANQDNLEATIHRAVDLGINHIETARGYGSSEMQLGWVLPHIPREKIIVQTKVRPCATQKEFYETFEQSMDYLKLDHVDLLSLHGVNDRQHLDWSLRKGGSLEAARKLQAEGRCRHVGFSTHATPDLIREAVESDAFDYINVHWYFVNDLNWSSIEAAKQRDMGVFIISPNDKGGQLFSPPPRLVDLCAPLSPMQFNALYCFARPEVHTLSCGAARPSDFDEHLRTLEFYDQIESTIAPIESRIRAEMDHVLGADWNQSWSEGLPEYVDVPGRINIVEILRLWMYSKALDIVGWGKMRYNLLSGEGGDWFPGEMARDIDDATLAPILANSPFADRIPDILREAHAL
ncbi:MAG: putative aldo/keto reductase-like oxidoreductase, partial [Candidatus Binatia bacterium]